MNVIFAETLRHLRTEKGLSQMQLGELLFVNHSTVARWERGNRLPSAPMIIRLAECLGVDANTLFHAAAASDEVPKVILVDDRPLVLSGSVPVVEEVLPYAEITGFTRPREALEYARDNRVALAFLDIEIGNTSGLDLCRGLLDINPRTNVVFLTAFVEYSFDAWSTGASGYLLKPLTPDGVREQLKRLRYPLIPGADGE